MNQDSITKQWRDHIVDINDIPFQNDFVIVEEVSYPHASNEITEVKAKLDNHLATYMIKVSRRSDSFLEREIEILNKVKGINTSKIIESGTYKGNTYILEEVVPGRKMSMLHNDGLLTDQYYKSFGESLGKIHTLSIESSNVPTRVFHNYKNYDEYINNIVNKWLKSKNNFEKDLVFCHGDHHYANVLFDSPNEYYVLDWELAGLGWKEFDLAWAYILRPGQKFFKKEQEEQLFLSGYSKYSIYNKEQYDWCKVLIASHFYAIADKQEDIEYKSYLVSLMNKIIEGE